MDHEAKVVLLKDEIRKRHIQRDIFAKKESLAAKRKMQMARGQATTNASTAVLPGVTCDF